jgi:hypothetical protein
MPRQKGARSPHTPQDYSTELMAAQNGGGHVLAESFYAES